MASDIIEIHDTLEESAAPVPEFDRKTFWTEWIIDLRTSGAAQGKSVLKCENAYCCLGRAAELAVGMYHIGSWTYDMREARFNFKGIAKVGLLPEEFCALIGLSTSFMQQLTRMNDTYGMNFHQIGYEVWAYAKDHKLIPENWVLP